MFEIACPSCGDAVRFRSDSSVYATCESCRSLLVRHDVDVESLGRVADLVPDGTPLQVGTSGVYQGVAFEVLGRIQVRYPDGFWNEWYLQFRDGRDGWLGEALGEYFVSFRVRPEGAPLPAFPSLHVGMPLRMGDHEFVVTTLSQARAVSFQGELPFVMSTDYDLPYADLRSASRAGATLDYSEEQPLLFVGEYRDFEELELKGLRNPEEELERRTAAGTRILRCPNCGAPHELVAGPRSQTLVCGFCDAGIDLTDPTFSLLWKAQSVPKVQPDLPLGAKGTFEGASWECLGFQRRFVKIEGVAYYWSEYLLYNRERGYRYLVDSSGHWSWVGPLDRLPVGSDGHPVHGWPPQDFLRLGPQKFRHFQSSQGRVAYVVGEFPWRVKVNDEAALHDYVCPPGILSAEVTAEGMTWSVGRYVEPSEVWAAFGLSGSPPPRTGVGANQPSPFSEALRSAWTSYAFVALLGFMMMVGFSMFARHEPVYRENFTVVTNEEPSRVSNAFELKGRTSNVVIELRTDLSNRWAFFDMALVNEKTREALNFSKAVSYYHGVDGGESWSEGSAQDSVTVPSVPAGTYVLRVDPQTGTGDSPDNATLDPKGEKRKLLEYSLTVVRDVPSWGWYWMLVILMPLYPLYLALRQASFEQKRWMESDHPPASSSD